ncbi:hypothetical protein Fmac_002975 [Flemingia macrophylla]|uniref:Protein kinase domain-containing protein n=1 Tax=Flemingia macrophylla TaxID=520843 RepID=A0ABD1NLG2_9FABA
MELPDICILKLVAACALCLHIFIRSASATEGFENIACCADSNYTDPRTTLNYTTDYRWFSDKGSCRRTGTGLNHRGNEKVRLFIIDEGKRCYNFPTIKNKVYLIRGTFPFENVNSSFNVSIGVTQLGTVRSSGVQDLEIEGVFRATKNYIDFCLVKWEVDPFISQIELRPLPEEYLHDLPRNILKLISRNSLWGTKDEIRFPIDPSDRIWRASSSPSSAFRLSYNVSNFDLKSNVTPPLQVLQTALTHPERLQFNHSGLDNKDYEYCVFLYFLELNSSVKPGKRVFDIYVNGEIKRERFDILAGGSNYTYTVLNVSANGLLNLTLAKASGAEFGPLLNAYEILQMRPWIEETNQQDVEVIQKIKEELLLQNQGNKAVESWSGDPCFFPWQGIACDGSSVITKLDLSSSNFKGPIPSGVTEMPNLKLLNLSHNNFDGSIPTFPLSSLLISIDLSYNDLMGSLPESIVSLPYLKSLYFRCNKHMSEEVPAKLNSSLIDTDKDDFLIKSVAIQTFTLEDIEMATQKYKTLIGEGGFGSVYRGTLNDGQEVAVKVRSATSTQGTREFDNELNLLSAIQHENLVPLLGYCNENDQQILVYPFMSNGSLQDRLYGLAYLHTFPGRSVIHRDVKSSNILLDHSMCAKVADFGFSKYAPQEGDSNVSLEVRGTAGYLDPEYYKTQQLSEKSDVFSFGVVLLEIVSGREPLDVKRPRNEWSLVEWAKPYIRASKMDEIVDPGIKGGYHAEAMWRVVEVALQCLEPFSAYRPCMVDIVRELEDALIIENNASEYMKSIDSLGGSNRYSIVIEKRVLPSTSSTAESTITTQALSHPQPR